MEEQKKIERDLMSQEEFENYISTREIVLHFGSYNLVHKFKSVKRAIRREHITINGDIIPRRPFHNRANSCERKNKHSKAGNELKKKIYAELKQYQRGSF